MNDYDPIPIQVKPQSPEHTGEPNAPSAQLIAVLNEIQTLLRQLIDQNKESAIDLRSLPLFPGDFQQLKQILGEGEINIQLQAMGPSTFYETHIPGVWWVSHLNENEEILAEYIEVTRIPSMVTTTQDDLNLAPHAIDQLIEQISTPPAQ